VINQIAAGEVIERPASVVKELVENSLDAGATSIEIEVERGGTAVVRVVDNGVGMDRDDAVMCFERHATSKITSARDLFSISSMGFRGEALASIAAVARVELESSDSDSGVGTRVVVAGGEIEHVEETVRVPGTTVTVRHLFYNVPVRRGFLRSKESETRAVVDVLFRNAVARPGVGFKLIADKRQLWNLPEAANLQARLHQLLGSERAEKLIPVETVAPGVEIEGWVYPPGEERAGKRQQVMVVNGRPADSPAVRAALASAFQGAMPSGKRLQGYILINVEPDKVDVNVHPAKREVRFREPRRITGVLIDVLRKASGQAGAQLAEAFRESSGRQFPQSRALPQHSVISPGASKVRENELLWEFSPDKTSRPQRDPALQISTREVPLLQIAGTYLVATMGDSLLVFDQHACHERVLYEETLRRLEGVRGMAQQLLFPFTVDLSPKEISLAEEFDDELRRVGFGLRRFGDKTYIVEAVPADIDSELSEELVRQVIAGLGEDWGAIDTRHHRVASSIACHSAIKAGESLSDEQMRRLIDRLLATETPQACPHGRPTYLQITPAELERRFLRT
jgi:DNA mismatch repair protein MutL